MKARTVKAVALNLAVALIALVVMFPLAWMVSVSFMSTGEAATFPPPLLPETWTLDHYRDLFVTQGMGRYLWNSFALASLAYMWARTAKAAQARVAANDPDPFYKNKLITARHFVERIAPEGSGHLAKLKSGSANLMSLPAEAF